MNTFPFVLTSIIPSRLLALRAILKAATSGSINEGLGIREIPEARVPPQILAIVRSGEPEGKLNNLLEANEGLLDSELASADPFQTWLDRYLTPPTQFTA